MQADDDLEVFFVGFFGGGDDATIAGGIGADGFFHEDIFALLDGVFEHHGSEAGRGGEDDDIEPIDGILVGIEADELFDRRGR